MATLPPAFRNLVLRARDGARPARLAGAPRDVGRAEPPSASAPAPVVDEDVEDPPVHGVAALTSWAERHGVRGLLLGSIDVLADVGDVPEVLLDLAVDFRIDTLAGALLQERLARPRKQVARATLLAQGARAFLCTEIAHLRRAHVGERVPAAPEDPALRGFGERLLELRASVRAANHPARVGYDVEVEVESKAPAFLAQLSREPGQALSLHLGFEQAPIARCECMRGPASCQHVLAAIDAVLRLIADPAQPGFRSKVAGALRSPWQRALAELAQMIEPSRSNEPATARPALTTGWRLKRSNNRLQLRPCTSDGKRTRDVSRYDLGGEGWRPIDRAAMSLLDGYASYHDPSGHLGAALELLAGDPRLVYAEGARTRPMVVRAARTEMVGEHDPAGLRLSLVVDGRALTAEELALLPPGGGALVVVRAGAEPAPVEALVTRIDARLMAAWTTLRRQGAVVPAEVMQDLTALAPRLAQTLPVRLPEALLGRAIPAAPRAVLRLEILADDSLAVEAHVRVVPGAPAFPPGAGPRDVFLVHEGERGHARRELEAESAWVANRLAPLGLPDTAAGGHSWRLVGDEALDLVARLGDPAAQAELDLEWPKGRARQVLTSGALRVDVREKRDWFGLSGGLDVDGEQVALAELLAALRAGRRYVRVTGDRWARLDDELRRRLTAVSDLTASSGPVLELPAMAAPLLEEILGDTLGEAPLRWRELIARARDAASAPPAALPPLGVTLRDYQIAGFEWMSRLASWGAGACLADDMGLGKTIQALAVLATRASLGPALVVAPTSVGWNWVREAERCAPELRVSLFSRSERDSVISSAGPGDVIVVSYGLLVRHAEAFASRRFATLVFDEAHALKNPATRRAQAAAALSSDFKLALTGTPLENRLTELWSLFRIVTPGLLGGLDRFRERFATPIERDRDDSRRAALARLTRPFLLRRLKSEVARELPPRTEVQVDVTLSKAERSVYDAIRVHAAQALAGDFGGDQRFAMLAALTRLRQAACDVGLLDESITTPSSKLARLVELVDELREEGHRVLVFSQFTGLLGRARAAVEASGASCLYLDGATPEGRRRELVDAFQGGQGDAFFISLKAGGAGLNLTGADNVIHLDPWWNPAVEDQATDRAHRIGQERPVTVYRLVASGTVEEAILKLHGDKRALVAGVLEGSGTAGTLDPGQLAALLQTSSDAALDDDPAEAPDPAERPPVNESPPAGSSDPLVGFRAHLIAGELAASTAATYSASVARWLSGQAAGQSRAQLLDAATRATSDASLPKMTRVALKRWAGFIAS